MEDDSTKTEVGLDDEAVAFPTWPDPDGVENITENLASDILDLLAQAQLLSTVHPDVQFIIGKELADFQTAIKRVVGQDGDFCRRLPICEMQAEIRNVKVASHRLRTEQIMLTSELDLSDFVYAVGQALYGIPYLTADDKDDLLLCYPERFQRAMELDDKLLDLLTDSNGVRISTEKVTAIVEQVFQAIMSDTFVDVEQYVPDTGSFDLSKYLLDDEALICLFQMAKYLDMCACVSHLGLQCICHREDFGLVNMNCQMDGTFIPRTGKHRNKSE